MRNSFGNAKKETHERNSAQVQYELSFTKKFFSPTLVDYFHMYLPIIVYFEIKNTQNYRVPSCYFTFHLFQMFHNLSLWYYKPLQKI